MLSSRSAAGGLVCILVCGGIGLMTESGSALTAAVAKKCEALTIGAYPPRVPGNPAAGSAKGTPQIERDYYRKCIANAGTVKAGPK